MPGATKDIRLSRTLTQSDLAAMVGGTRQRVNQILGDFADEDLLRMTREGATGFLVNDPVAARKVLAEAMETRP